MTLKTPMVLTTLLPVILIAFLSVKTEQVAFSCTGEYFSSIFLDNYSIESVNNISLTMMRNSSAYVSFNSMVKNSGSTRHISREVMYKLFVIDKENGLYKINSTKTKFHYVDSFSNNNELAAFLFGVEGRGRMIRIWKVSNKVILIGNPFSPIMSCIKSS